MGLRGTGKTTVGRLVAGRRGLAFADADVELERHAGRSIGELFERDGEPAFRDLEEEILQRLTMRDGLVLATGGGVVLREANRRALRGFGFVVWLTADPGLLAERLAADPRGLHHRPALTGAGTLAELTAVLEARTPLYRAVADLAIDTAGRTPTGVADAILRAWPGPPLTPLRSD